MRFISAAFGHAKAGLYLFSVSTLIFFLSGLNGDQTKLLAQEQNLSAQDLKIAADIKKFFEFALANPEVTFTSYNMSSRRGEILRAMESLQRLPEGRRTDILRSSVAELSFFQKIEILSRRYDELPDSAPIKDFWKQHAISPDFLIEAKDLEFAVKFLQGSVFQGAITYNGDTGTHDYTNERSQKTVRALLALILNSTEEDLARVNEMTRGILSHDTNSLDPNTRAEIFDLLVSEYKAILKSDIEIASKSPSWKFDLDPSLFTAAARNRLSIILTGAPHPVQNLPVVAFREGQSQSNRVLLVCNTGESSISRSSSRSQSRTGSLTGGLNFHVVQFENPRSEFELRCGDKSYIVKGASLGNGRLPFPPEVNFQAEIANDGQIEFLATLSLTEAVDKASLAKLIGYLGLRGFVPDGPRSQIVQPVADVKREFSREFVNSNVYFAAGHSVDLSALEIGKGSGEGSKIVVRKVYPAGVNGEPSTARLTIITPPANPGSGGKITVTRNELVDLLCERREVQENPALFMTLSCRSSGQVRGWMNSYRESVLKTESLAGFNPQQVTDVPLIIGANRGFSTNSSESIASTMEYALRTIDTVMAGGGSQQIIEILKQPVRPPALETLNATDLQGLRVNSVAQNAGFEPVCNRDSEYSDLFSFGALLNEIRIQDREDPSHVISY
jgi:hypothetical protein